MAQSGSFSKLKRQLSFLKSIDQKLEGLRRENERLRRLVSNPRVRFSRSSLGGLHRIVNSLKSAGPTEDIAAVEAWSDKAKEWLVTLGRRGEGPSNNELDWLSETIRELGDIRDNAVAELEVRIGEISDERKSDLPDDDEPDLMNPETLPPDAFQALEEMSDSDTAEI